MTYIMFLRIPNMIRYTRVIKYEYRMMSSPSIVQTNNNGNIIIKNMNEVINWYEQVTGMDEVHAAQNRVLEEEKKLASAQEHRREVNKMAKAVQAKLRELHAELDLTKRGDDRYVYLITEEHSLLKEEHRLTAELQQYEREERDYFTALSCAVKESHEKERAQAQRTKYWSIIGSIIGTVIGIAGSSLNNHFKLKRMENLVKESVKGTGVNSGNIPQLLLKQEAQLNQIAAQVKALSVLPSKTSHTLFGSGSVDKIDKVLRLLEQQQAVLHNRFMQLEVLIKHSLVHGTTTQPSPSVPAVAFPREAVEAAVAFGVLVFVVAMLCSCCR